MMSFSNSHSSDLVLTKSRFRSIVHAGLVTALVLGLGVTGMGCSSSGSNGEDDGEEPTAPAAPSGLEATSGNAQVGLEWSSVSEADAYNVYRETSSTSGASGSPIEEGVSSATYTDDGVDNGTTYYYRVTAVGPDGLESGASGEEEVTPFDDPPDRP